MKTAIGIDLGGTKISGVLINEKGRVLQKYVRPTQAEMPSDVILENVNDVINHLSHKGVKTIGIGIPGLADSKGTVTFMPNVKSLLGINLKKEIEKKTRLKVILSNDANCFALAEVKLGAAKGLKNVVGVIIGTGVGSGIIINSKIYEGASGGAGEIGHSYFKAGENPVEVEAIISGTAFLKRYKELTSKDYKHISEIDKKQPAYKLVYNEFLDNVGVFFANIVNTLNPEMIVVGGGLSNLDFYKESEERMKKLSVKELGNACKIRKNKLGADAGVLGAGMMALDAGN